MESGSEDARRPEIYGVGCAGVIVDHNELADGRFNLLLEGRTHFRISTELDTPESFRRVHAEAWPELPEDENDRSLITVSYTHLTLPTSDLV